MPEIIKATTLIDLKRTLGEIELLSGSPPSEGSIASKIDKKERGAIRKAVKSGINVEITNNPKDIDECYRLYFEMTKRNYLHTIKKEAIFTKDRSTLVAKYNNKIISFMTVGDESERWDQKTGTLIANATNAEYRILQPNALLYWESIKFFKNKGYEYLNLAGLDTRSQQEHLVAIDHFKRRWGGEEIVLRKKVDIFRWIYWKALRHFKFFRYLNYKLQKLFIKERTFE